MRFAPELPPNAPCTCDELHKGKRVSGTFDGMFDPQPFRGWRYWRWNDCPQHGFFEVSSGLFSERSAYDRGDDWTAGGVKYSLEPPWEPKYYFPKTDQEATYLTYKYRRTYMPISEQIGEDYTDSMLEHTAAAR